jgi:hypothetical protein
MADAAMLLVACGAVSTPAPAQTSSADWQFTAIVYGYLPEFTGSATFPTGMTANITIDPNQIIPNLNFGFMGAFEAQRPLGNLHRPHLHRYERLEIGDTLSIRHRCRDSGQHHG